MMRVDCEKELGRWTVRADGHYIMDFPWWRRWQAFRLAHRLQKLLLGMARS